MTPFFQETSPATTLRWIIQGARAEDLLRSTQLLGTSGNSLYYPLSFFFNILSSCSAFWNRHVNELVCVKRMICSASVCFPGSASGPGSLVPGNP